jgi:peptidoglycan hydrolase-like protein with peptidoglycan-binding domain
VTALQRALRTAGYNLAALDGVFGPGTERAVIAFQKSKGLPPDGIVGPATRRALGLT